MYNSVVSWHQALRDFPQSEIDDPTHEHTPFTGPAKRFAEGGLAWDRGERSEAAPSIPLDQQRLLQVAVIGVPNAGKSSMVNALVGSKVCTANRPEHVEWHD